MRRTSRNPKDPYAIKVGDRVALRGRPSWHGTVAVYDPSQPWTLKVLWDEVAKKHPTPLRESYKDVVPLRKNPKRTSRNPSLYCVKLTASEQDIVGEFDNDVWLSEVGLRPEGGGVFSGDERAMRLLRGAFLDRADPLDDWGLSAAQRRMARKAALKVEAALGATSRNGRRVRTTVAP